MLDVDFIKLKRYENRRKVELYLLRSHISVVESCGFPDDNDKNWGGGWREHTYITATVELGQKAWQHKILNSKHNSAPKARVSNSSAEPNLPEQPMEAESIGWLLQGKTAFRIWYRYTMDQRLLSGFDINIALNFSGKWDNYSQSCTNEEHSKAQLNTHTFHNATVTDTII